MRPQAEIMAKRNLLISEIYRQEGISVTDEEIDERITRMVGEETEESADTVRALRDMMKSGSGRAVLESQILQEKSIARLLAIVRGEELPERPAPKEESAETPSEAATEAENAPQEAPVAQIAPSTDEAATGESAA
jgi:FKBP-type peptidyl-prolyl cis-trans isomerase (trigger factor)